MSGLPTWDIDLIEASVVRVKSNAKLHDKDRQRVERYLPMLKKAHGELLDLFSGFASPGAAELARRYLRRSRLPPSFLALQLTFRIPLKIT